MKKVVKLIPALVGCLALLFVIASCDNTNSNTDNGKQETVTPVDPESSGETKPSNPDTTVDPGHDNDQSEGHVHRFYETYIANEVSPTCTQNGSYDIVGICLDCKMEVREHKIIEKLGHDLIHHDAKNATCNTSGHKEYDTCSRCNYTTYEAIPALGHDYHKTDEFEATYDNDGYISYECSRCGDTYNEVTIKAQVCEKLSLGRSFYNDFYYVEALSTDIVGAVVIPKTYNGLPVKNITNDAFFDCRSLTNITIPNSITSIGSGAFSYCTSLTNVYYDGTVEDWCNIEFDGYYSNPMNNTPNFYILDENGTIENNGKKYKLLTELEIPSTVTSISDYQFYGFNQFIDIMISDNVTCIGEYAFFDCRSLTSITIPDSITNIGEYAFYNCSSLTEVYYDGTIEDWCNITFDSYYSNPMYYATNFYILDENGDIEHNGKNYKLLTELEIPSTVTSIGNYQFYGFKQFTGIIIPDSVTSIRKDAFADCRSLTNITIPSSITSIGREAFSYCTSLTNVYYDGTIEDWCNITFSVLDSNPMSYATNFYILDENGTIENNGKKYKLLTELVVPSTVKLIGNYQFYGFNQFIDITIPDSVTSIGQYAFEYCRSLTNITLPNSITSIGKYAFCGCTSLTNITIPNSVTSIGNSAFYNCSLLENVYYDETIEDWCNITFSDEYSNPMNEATKFYILDENGDIEHNGKKYKLLTELEIPSTVTSIGNYQFYGFNQFIDIMISDNVTSIGSDAFSSCTSLTNITLPNSITSIGERAFQNCASLTNITIPNSITSIGSGAFSSCTSLTNITIPNSITSIGSGAFLNCFSLTNVYYDGTIVDWSNITFSNGKSNPIYYATNFYIFDENGTIENNGKKYKLLTELVVPSTVKLIGNYQFYGFNQFIDITIPDSVTSIGTWAFSGCSLLTSITIPDSVTSIGSDAFSSCTSLTNITLPNSITSIGERAFYSPLTKVYYKGTSSDTDTITSIADHNQSLTSATWYYFTSNGSKETVSGNWWYYDTDGKTIIEKVIS